MTIQVRSNEKPQTPPPVVPAANAAESNPAVEGSGGPKEQTPTSSAPEDKSSEQNKASESETGAENEPEANKEGEPKNEPEDKESGKKKGGFQRRIDKLSAQKTQIEQERDYWRQQAIQSASGGRKDTQVNSPKFESNASAGKPIPESFETHAEYVEALTDWKTDQKLKERDQKAAKERFDQEQSKVVTSYNERMKSFSSKTPDFQEVLEEVDHIPISPTLQDIILNSENGPELAYELAKNPEEYERISKLPPTACAREIGKFEARFNSSSKASGTEKKITQAPAPIAPVGTGGKGSVQKSIFDPGLTQKEYEALRREQIKKRRQAG